MNRDAPRQFDGVLFFGGVDWWYHNRGHYDLQMAREFSKVTPVLYINSIGMRVPKLSEGAVFLARVKRKVRSLSRGMTRINDRFAVFSPVVMPGRRLGAMTRRTLPSQAAWAARRMGMKNPLVWVACPPAANAAMTLSGAGLVYQRTDRFEAYRGVDAEAIRRDDRLLKRESDITLFCSSLLFEHERADCRGGAGAVFVDHGVDYDVFAAAGERAMGAAPGRGPEAGAAAGTPEDVKDMKRPIVGFIGGIDEQTFDPALFNEVAGRMPDVTFMLVGTCSLAPGWCTHPNVRQLGKRAYEQVAWYMAASDVLIMPWNTSEWIRACNPVKLKEYLAVGRPVVTMPFDELRKYNGHVRVASDASSFVAAIREALNEPGDALSRRERVRTQTWRQKAQDVLEALRARGLEPVTGSGR